jgi:hypothetical protein
MLWKGSITSRNIHSQLSNLSTNPSLYHSKRILRSKVFHSNPKLPKHTSPSKMQFSLPLLAAAFAASASASYAPYNLTTSATPYYPTGTGTGAPVKPTSTLPPFTGAAAVAMPTHFAGSALGVVVVGGIALVS